MDHGSFFQGKDSLHYNDFQFSEMNKLLANSAIFLLKCCFGKLFSKVLAIKELISKN